MNKKEFLLLMSFPDEWERLEMYPDELFDIQLARYVPGHEEASEHDRHGAFWWWLKRSPSETQLENLLYLARIDPDRNMGEYVKDFVQQAIDNRTDQNEES